MEALIPACKAVVQEGPRKGQLCKFPPQENGYCGRHERNKIYDVGISEGKKWCRFFFRGCNNTIDSKSLTCDACKQKKHEGKSLCQHEGCSNHVKSDKFCQKHQRDIYYLEEKEKGVRYCDISRGCFTICNGGNKSCDECLEVARQKDKARFDSRKQLQNILKQVNSSVRVCVDCGKEYEKFITNNNNESNRCNHCNQTQQNQDNKRLDRERNFKNEMFKNRPRFFKEYVNGAIKRNYEFLLTFDDFNKLVDSECFYCHHNIIEEVNGIDRVDNTKGYTKENTVSCCEKCNRMKYLYHPQFFLEKCKIIATGIFLTKGFYKTWSQYYSKHNHNYTNYKKVSTEKRGIAFNLTQAEWDKITREACYLCGYKSVGGVGLDRVINSIREYSVDSVKPCCGSCNTMKGELTLEEFREKCVQISDIWKTNKFFQNIPIQKENNVDGKTLQTVIEARKVWKAAGLYYTILNGEESQFADFYKEVLKDGELAALCVDVKKDPKEKSLEYLSRFLQNLKDRRKRRRAKKVL